MLEALPNSDRLWDVGRLVVQDLREAAANTCKVTVISMGIMALVSAIGGIIMRGSGQLDGRDIEVREMLAMRVVLGALVGISVGAGEGALVSMNAVDRWTEDRRNSLKSKIAAFIMIAFFINFIFHWDIKQRVGPL